MSLKTRETNASLSSGYTSEGLEKDGPRATLVATFSGLTTTRSAWIEQSVDGDTWMKSPGSDVTLTAGQTNQMWNDDVTPRGTLLRLRVASGTGRVTTVKLLSNG
ncbi:MAG: hypothetical protein IKN32_10210 [Bacteroidales bacterium]|nr:hypothetical protein [Bacteroidales bacterium]